MYYGLQTSEYPFLKDYPVRNNSMGLAYYGGYGYGVHSRNITGGFGFAITDTDGDTGIPGTPFEDFLVYTPVVGVRVAWGKFY